MIVWTLINGAVSSVFVLIVVVLDFVKLFVGFFVVVVVVVLLLLLLLALI